jgi:hypothetical protein
MNMINLAALLAAALLAFAQHESMPPGMSHEEHMKQMADRGKAAMGFDQDKAVHHFHLTNSGGEIEVSSADEVTRGQIRAHLRTIAQEFATGVFTSPVTTHAEVPPGVPMMQERKARIKYSYEETSSGALVRIETKDKAARNAAHEFLKYQIREHSTGDPIAVRKSS